ncbi:MAG: helix-turn-helix transcriptional regulator, partial [Micromonosporaceae bacterium]
AGLGCALVVETARAFAAERDLAIDPQWPARGALAVASMRRHLVDNLARPVTVRDVAAAVHLSERHAERLFREQTGASLMATLRRLRMELAGRRLLEGDLPVGEVARACGYADARAFSTAFRRHHGQTPGEFRTTRGTVHGDPSRG